MGAYKEIQSDNIGTMEAYGDELDELFTSNAYSIEQPFFQFLQEGYKISAPGGREVFNAVRKRKWFKSIASFFGAIFVAGAASGPNLR